VRCVGLLRAYGHPSRERSNIERLDIGLEVRSGERDFFVRSLEAELWDGGHPKPAKNARPPSSALRVLSSTGVASRPYMGRDLTAPD